MRNRIDLVLGENVYISNNYHIADSWLSLLNVYDLYFWLRDSANRHERANDLIRGFSLKGLKETNFCKCLVGGWGSPHQILRQKNNKPRIPLPLTRFLATRRRHESPEFWLPGYCTFLLVKCKHWNIFFCVILARKLRLESTKYQVWGVIRHLAQSS